LGHDPIRKPVFTWRSAALRVGSMPIYSLQRHKKYQTKMGVSNAVKVFDIPCDALKYTVMPAKAGIQ
jgi:hypothetical protein